MELDQARQHLNEMVWWKLSGSEEDPEPVRMLSTHGPKVRVTRVLNISQAVFEDEAFDADPEDLHFEKSGFEDL